MKDLKTVHKWSTSTPFVPSCMAFIPSANQILAVNDHLDPRILVFNSINGEYLFEIITNHVSGINLINVISIPNHDILVILTGGSDGIVNGYNLEFKHILTFNQHADALRCLSHSDLLPHIASAGIDFNLYIWDISHNYASGQEVEVDETKESFVKKPLVIKQLFASVSTTRGNTAWINVIDFGDRYLTVGHHDGLVCIWSVEDWIVRKVFKLKSSINGIATAFDENILCVSNAHNEIKFYDHSHKNINPFVEIQEDYNQIKKMIPLVVKGLNDPMALILFETGIYLIDLKHGRTLYKEGFTKKQFTKIEPLYRTCTLIHQSVLLCEYNEKLSLSSFESIVDYWTK